MPVDFTSREREALTAAHLAVFRERVILKAQPPVDAKALARVQKHCEGPIPPALVSLWKTAFGGRLDYDLRADFGKHQAALSFAELFFPKSGGYRDLWGWIEHEEELAAEASRARGEKRSGLLKALPFGGFEYAERLYVMTKPGDDAGSVWAWVQGLGPAWNFYLHRDSLARVASDVNGLFDALNLERDPWTADPATHPTGLQMLEAIDSLEAASGAGKTAAAKLQGLVRACILDWRSAVEAGTVANHGLLRRLALENAARADDVDLLRRLKGLGCNIGESVTGGTTALEHALSAGSMKVARYLIDEGLPVSAALIHGAHSVDLALADELLKKGSTVNEQAVFSAVNAGKVDVALLMIEFAGLTINSLQLAIRARERAGDEERSAKAVEAGTLISNVSPAESRRRSKLLNDLADRVDPTLRT